MSRSSVLKVQGLYYILTGLWPVIHMPTFEWVTGPKVDDWLVKMVGLLALVIGATLFIASRRNSSAPEILTLAIGAALAFTSVDTWYALSGRISPIYLADAVTELALVAALLLSQKR